MKKMPVLLVLLISACTAPLLAQSKSFFTSGYYDGISMTSKQSGDYGGISVYLTQSADDTYAVVSIAEGVPMPPILVPVKVGKDGRTVEFVYDSPSYGRKLTLKGTVRADGLMLSGYGDKPELLKRKCANTYSDIAGGGGGDSGGTEIFITDADGSWYAVVTTAEGTVGRPVLVPAEVTGKDFDHIAFTLPGAGKRKFTGIISARSTALTLSAQGSKSVLKRRCYQ